MYSAFGIVFGLILGILFFVFLGIMVASFEDIANEQPEEVEEVVFGKLHKLNKWQNS